MAKPYPWTLYTCAHIHECAYVPLLDSVALAVGAGAAAAAALSEPRRLLLVCVWERGDVSVSVSVSHLIGSSPPPLTRSVHTDIRPRSLRQGNGWTLTHLLGAAAGGSGKGACCLPILAMARLVVITSSSSCSCSCASSCGCGACGSAAGCCWARHEAAARAPRRRIDVERVDTRMMAGLGLCTSSGLCEAGSLWCVSGGVSARSRSTKGQAPASRPSRASRSILARGVRSRANHPTRAGRGPLQLSIWAGPETMCHDVNRHVTILIGT